MLDRYHHRMLSVPLCKNIYIKDLTNFSEYHHGAVVSVPAYWGGELGLIAEGERFFTSDYLTIKKLNSYDYIIGKS